MPRKPTEPTPSGKRRVCFVTGTRAEFGLMESTLRAIEAHRALRLQLVVTGMHLDPRHGRTIDEIRRGGWRIDARVPWASSRGSTPGSNAVATGNAVAGLAAAFARLRPDVVLVVGDRVEAFAAASAAHIGHIPVAHVHGGDRALGQVDDALRHAITKLAHVHFPATAESAERIRKLGEDAWRIHTAGSPGIDQIRRAASRFEEVLASMPGLRRRRYGVLIYHPAEADDGVEHDRAAQLLAAVDSIGFERVVVIYPNNDPGGREIRRMWDRLAKKQKNGQYWYTVRRDVPRSIFLGLIRDAAVLAGNSSAGIIEAASFGTPVLDVGRRQEGRQRSDNVFHVDSPFEGIPALRRIWNGGRPLRFPLKNPYGGGGTSAKISDILARLPIDERLLRKLITY